MRKACILSVSGPELLPAEAAMLAEFKPWAMILMGRSCMTRSQVRKLIDDIWNALGHACLIFIDQEGGRVARLKAPEWPVFPSAKSYADLYAQDHEAGLAAVWLGHRLMAAELTSMSIHADCAPVADLSVPGAHDIIGDRSFGSDPVSVALLARKALEGLRDGGVAGVIKHIPGHGRALADSHDELPTIHDDLDQLNHDFDAFARLADAPMAMTAHIAFEAIDGGTPVTLSRKLIDGIIRQKIGFDGLLMSDDLGMKALGGTLSARAQGAIEAGCDVLLHCSGFVKNPEDILREMTEVADTAPTLSGLPLERANRADLAATHRTDFDVSQGWKDFYGWFPQLRGAA